MGESILPGTRERVTRHTAPALNERIRRETEQRLRLYADAPNESIEARLAELDREWDVERALEANAATLIVLSVLGGFTVHRALFAFPGVVGAFLLQHALSGWCPPLPVLRRLGYRTAAEIEEERHALLALRH